MQNITNYPLIFRDIGLQDYQTIWNAMKNFVDRRTEKTLDEIWLLEHPPIFTLGQNGKQEHLLNPGNIEVLQIDRGGQVTYHGPGQLVAYILIDLKRLNFGVRQLVTSLENAIISLLKNLGIESEAKSTAPGVYVNQEKICSLGLRIRRGCSYHGLALNIDMDLTPFQYINPCGQHGLVMTQLRNLKKSVDMNQIKCQLITHLAEVLSYKQFLVTRKL